MPEAARTEPVLRDYGEGLPGLFWRNFFGSPFSRMFGDSLESLPPERRRDLGDGVWLVEPYPDPGQAGTDSAEQAERRLMDHLGPDAFYDSKHHRKPQRMPRLSHPHRQEA